MKRWEALVDIFHVYNVTPLPGAGLYKTLGGKKPVIATLNNYFGFCPVSLIFGACFRCSNLKIFRCLELSQSRSITAKIGIVPYAIIFPLLKKLSRKLESYIALSCFVKKIYSQFGYEKHKIYVIPNFIDKTTMQMIDGTGQHKKNAFTFLYVGRLSQGKGIELLLKAFSMLSKDCVLLIVGTGPQKSYYQKLARLLKIDDRITFTGYIDNRDLHKMYSTCDVMIHPATWPEPFGRTLLEAMSFNVPLLVSSAGAPPEIIKNAGIVFESGNVNDLKAKMELMMHNSDLFNYLKANTSDVLKKYEVTPVFNQIVALYRKVLTEHSNKDWKRFHVH